MMTRIRPPVRGRCKFSPEELTGHLVRNLAHGISDLYAISGDYKGSLAIVNGGPSMDFQWDVLNGLDMPVMAISRMLPALVEWQIFPNFVVSMDASLAQQVGFAPYLQKATYLMSSVANADVVDRLVERRSKVYLFDSFTDEALREHRTHFGYRVATAINAGGSVSVACLGLAMNLGFTDLHVFGMDLSVPKKEATHAHGIAGPSVAEEFFPVVLRGKTYLTCCPYIEFANQTLDLLEAGRNSGLLKSAKFYGPSLINGMWDGSWPKVEQVKGAIYDLAVS